jgi:uncharacterized protein YegP (UPF0339 family)
VAIEVRDRSARVASAWLVDGPAVQSDHLAGDWVGRVDVDGRPVLVQSFDDPLLVRGIGRPRDPTHSYLREDRGMLEIDVPLAATEPAGDITVRVADLTGLPDRPTEPEALARLFDDRPRRLRMRATITSAELESHPDFVAVAPAIGRGVAPQERFEIYRDRAGRFRWRLRRHDGQIVADSGQGYERREDCEADLRWIRSAAPNVPVRPLDLD